MKIAVDARSMGSCPSGVGIYLYDFMKALVSNADFDFVLITDVAESEQICSLKKMGVTIYGYGKRIFRSAGVLSYFKFVEKILTAEQPDLFWEPNNLLPMRFRHYRGKIVVTLHDLFPITKPEYFSRIYRLYFKRGIQTTLKQAHAVLFNSVETERQALKRFPQIHDKIFFVSYLIVQKPPAILISDDGFFLYIGNLEKRKGTDLLLNAYRKYRQAGGQRALLLGGNIREREIEKSLRTLQKEYKELQYLGYLGEKEKYDLLARCHCFLFPSRAEGFGIPPLEAIGYLKPVITSNLSIFREILQTSVQECELGPDAEKQLCELMLREDFCIIPPDKARGILDSYDGKTLGRRLQTFLVELAGGGHEGGV